MEHTRYRRDAFVIERNGTRVARVAPMPAPVADATVGDALAAWLDGADADPGFADDVAAINAADRPPTVRWARSRSQRARRGRTPPAPGPPGPPAGG